MNSFFIIWNVYFICAKVLKWFGKLYRFRLTIDANSTFLSLYLYFVFDVDNIDYGIIKL